MQPTVESKLAWNGARGAVANHTALHRRWGSSQLLRH